MLIKKRLPLFLCLSLLFNTASSFFPIGISWAPKPIFYPSGAPSPEMMRVSESIFGYSFYSETKPPKNVFFKACPFVKDFFTFMFSPHPIFALNDHLQKCGFLRPRGCLRCQIPDTRAPIGSAKTAYVIQDLSDLGITGRVWPSDFMYDKIDCIVIHGGEFPDLTRRIDFALDLIHSGAVACSKIIVLASTRPVAPQEFYGFCDISLDLKACQTEAQLANQLIDEHSGTVTIALDHSTQDEPDMPSFDLQFCIDTNPKSNTVSTIQEFIKTEAKNILKRHKYMFVSNAPFTARQHLTVEQVCASQGIPLDFITVGPKVDIDQLRTSSHFAAIFVDEFARLIYTLLENFKAQVGKHLL